MNSKRLYYVLLGSVGALFLAMLGGVYMVNSSLESKAATLVDLKLQSEVVTSQQQGLLAAKKQVAQYSDLEQIAKTIVPQDKDQAQAVREIAKIATDSGIKRLSSVTFPLSTLGGVAGTTPTGANSSSKSKLTQLAPVKGMSGVYQLQITIQQNTQDAITYNQFLTFLTKLEQNRRTAQVSSIILLPDTKNPNMVAFTLIINEFIKP